MGLSQKQKEELNSLYEKYKYDPHTSLKSLEGITSLDRTTIGKYYKAKFGKEYQELARLKGNFKTKMSEEIKVKISLKLKGKKKPPRTEQHKQNLSLAFLGRSYKERLKNNPQELERLKQMQPIGISKIESKMLLFLKEHFIENQDFYFDKQDITGKTLYRPDFQFPKQKVIIELYGYYKHFTKEGKEKDKIREYYLRKAGWIVYKFNFLEIERNFLFKKTKERIMKILNSSNNLANNNMVLVAGADEAGSLVKG